MNQRLVVITGASSGIGEAFARRLAPDHDLLLVARRGQRLQALADELNRASGSQIETLEADLTIDADVAKLADRLASDDRLILLVNNAGFGTRGRFWEAPLSRQEEMHRLHVLATLRLTHAALGNMVRRDVGAVINVASVAAFIRGPGNASYCATKSWMTAFTETLHLELKTAGSGVIVQALCPGYTYSEFHDVMELDRSRLAPRAFWLSAEQVVEESLEGVRRKKLFVVPGWQYRWLIGFLTKLPAALRLLIETKTGSKKRTAGPAIAGAHKPPGAVPNKSGTSADLAATGESVVRGSSKDGGDSGRISERISGDRS